MPLSAVDYQPRDAERLRCTDCTFERLVPFSCKGRGFCPSCGGRRMTECAARLVDEVLPRVPVRQWVLSLPYRLRYLVAWDHALARAVLGVSVRVLLGFQRHRARRHVIRDGRSGCVTVIQRFGSGLNLNPHFHTLLFDGVFFEGPEGALEFRPLPLPTEHRLAAIYASMEFVGGLIVYGVNYPDQYRRAARFADRIFKGANPADLPVEQPTKFELVINLKTAKALGGL